MNIRRYAHTSLLPRIWQLRDNMRPYDAAYVALAESLEAQLLTIDVKLERAPGIRCQILRPR
jgi:predicted nucleic acid-binding protein